MIDVGQGDSTLIEGPDGGTMLIDSGPWYNSDQVLDHLDAHDIDHLDHLVATHDDADHIGGHPDIIEAFGSDRIGAVHGPKMPGREEKDTGAKTRYEDALSEHGLEENQLKEGSSNITLSGVEVDVLNPSSEVGSTEYNENSLVMQITHGEQSFLLTGDAVGKAETHLVDNYSEQLDSVDVFKAPHHGADNGTRAEMLMTCSSAVVCFSHGENNQHDHPTRDTLARTRLADTEVVSSVVHGSTTFTLDGEETIDIEHEREVETRDVADVTAMIHFARVHGRDQLDPAEGIDTTTLPETTPSGLRRQTLSIPRKLQRRQRSPLRHNARTVRGSLGSPARTQLTLTDRLRHRPTTKTKVSKRSLDPQIISGFISQPMKSS
jgi:competence protein ComEC